MSETLLGKMKALQSRNQELHKIIIELWECLEESEGELEETKELLEIAESTLGDLLEDIGDEELTKEDLEAIKETVTRLGLDSLTLEYDPVKNELQSMSPAPPLFPLTVKEN